MPETHETSTPPILTITEITGLSHDDQARHWAELFILHDRLMLEAFARWAGPERAIEMHDRVWNNPTQPLTELFLNVGPTATEALVAYTKAFMIHDYYSFKTMREELGNVKAIEAHHSLWEGQATDFALTPGEERSSDREHLPWEELFRLYKAHADREGLPYELVETTDDKLVIETRNCVYFDTISEEIGPEEAQEHNHLIAIDSTDRTIEGFLLGIGQQDNFRGVMTRHRCHGDETCRIEFTKRDPEEPFKLTEPVPRVGTRCYFCS